MKRVIQAGVFKAQCLQIMDEVNREHYSVIITKRNVPIAKLCPIEEKKTSLFGKMKGTIHIIGDIIEPINEVWDADL